MNKNIVINSYRSSDNLRGFRGLALTLSLLVMLSACSTFSKKTPIEAPAKSFQFTYQAPTRTLLNSKVKLGRSYFSASGYACKKYTLQSGQIGSACKIGKRWYTASPVFLAN